MRQQGGDESREQELFHTLKTAYDRDSSYISFQAYNNHKTSFLRGRQEVIELLNDALLQMPRADGRDIVIAASCDLLRKAADRMDLTGYNLHYNKFEGSDEFRSAIAAHWQKVIFGADSDVVLTKDNVATCAGCTVALETLATLLAEPGDVFLIPAPYYSSFVDDINERAGVIAVGVP